LPVVKNAITKPITPVIALVLTVFVALVIISSRQTHHANIAAAWAAHTQEVLFQTEAIKNPGSYWLLLNQPPAQIKIICQNN
jgi:hypothetical protein